jgi:hypothetical protein
MASRKRVNSRQAANEQGGDEFCLVSPVERASLCPDVPKAQGMEPKPLRAIHGSPDRPLRIGDLEIPCYVLEDTTRVLSGRGMQAALQLGQRRGGLLASFLGKSNIRTFVSPELEKALEAPLRFVRPGRGGKLAVGYEATILADICDVILAARQAGALSNDAEMVIAEHCEILTRAFAKVGIIALVDEATGYQDIRPRDELHRILEAYIAKELLPWTRRFPPEFYKELFRLRGWQWDPMSVKRPKLVGRDTVYIVYERLPPGVLEELREKNPVIRPGTRRYHHHRFLTADIGNPHLERIVTVATALMRASQSWLSFRRLIERALPREVPQQELPLDLSDDEGYTD